MKDLSEIFGFFCACLLGIVLIVHVLLFWRSPSIDEFTYEGQSCLVISDPGNAEGFDGYYCQTDIEELVLQ